MRFMGHTNPLQLTVWISKINSKPKYQRIIPTFKETLSAHAKDLLEKYFFTYFYNTNPDLHSMQKKGTSGRTCNYERHHMDRK